MLDHRKECIAIWFLASLHVLILGSLDSLGSEASTAEYRPDLKAKRPQYEA